MVNKNIMEDENLDLGLDDREPTEDELAQLDDELGDSVDE